MRTFCWILAIVGALVSAGVLALTLLGANGSPQEAAGAAVAATIVIIPYVFARAVEGLSNNELKEQNKEIIKLLSRLGAAPLTKEEKANAYDRAQQQIIF